MANTFKVVTFAAEPASAGTAYKMYTCAGSTTTVVLGLILTNIHTTAVTAVVFILANTKPITTVVVLEGVVYTVYGVPAELGSAAKVTTLNVFAIYFLLFTYIYYIVILKNVNDYFLAECNG